MTAEVAAIFVLLGASTPDGPRCSAAEMPLLPTADDRGARRRSRSRSGSAGREPRPREPGAGGFLAQERALPAEITGSWFCGADNVRYTEFRLERGLQIGAVFYGCLTRAKWYMWEQSGLSDKITLKSISKLPQSYGHELRAHAKAQKEFLMGCAVAVRINSALMPHKLRIIR